jgi:hypothetical protein
VLCAIQRDKEIKECDAGQLPSIVAWGAGQPVPTEHKQQQTGLSSRWSDPISKQTRKTSMFCLYRNSNKAVAVKLSAVNYEMCAHFGEKPNGMAITSIGTKSAHQGWLEVRSSVRFAPILLNGVTTALPLSAKRHESVTAITAD